MVSGHRVEGQKSYWEGLAFGLSCELPADGVLEEGCQVRSADLGGASIKYKVR